ncbi:MAG: cyclic nucleotide-binding domain-containing protein [Deltaproteobacteria bacterium]|nr:cyclic nucleotide-binding domain-containing protein [Deltaproteobacteria bacterium]
MAKLEVIFKAGTTICEEGAVEDTMYYIKEGKVEIVRAVGNAKHIVAILGPGNFFGEMALVEKGPRSATAIAAKDTTAIVFNRTQFANVVKIRPEIPFKIIEGLILRLAETNDKIKRLIQRNQNALVFDSISKFIQIKEKTVTIQEASEWVASQLGMKTRETEAVIRKLVLMGFLGIENNQVTIKETESREKVRQLLEE